MGLGFPGSTGVPLKQGFDRFFATTVSRRAQLLSDLVVEQRTRIVLNIQRSPRTRSSDERRSVRRKFLRATLEKITRRI